MKLLVWACSVCLIGNGVTGLFFDELSEFFGGKTEEAAPNGMKPVNSNATTNGFLDELELAANRVDSLWQQFRKELLNMMNSSSASDDVDGHNTTTTVLTTGSPLQLEPNFNKMNAKLTTTLIVTTLPPPTKTATTTTATTTINIPTTKLELPSSTPLQ
ncbi:hypothetical protein ACLKA7_008497 [Drosophila subpalustris]